jgi:hypothetical protein
MNTVTRDKAGKWVPPFVNGKENVTQEFESKGNTE